MANELTVEINLRHVKGSVDQSQRVSKSVTVSGDNYIKNVQTIGTSAENISVVDVAAPGYVFVRNLDSTNFVQFGPDNTNWFVKAKALEPACFRLNGTSFMAKADTASCKVEIFI